MFLTVFVVLDPGMNVDKVFPSLLSAERYVDKQSDTHLYQIIEKEIERLQIVIENG